MRVFPVVAGLVMLALVIKGCGGEDKAELSTKHDGVYTGAGSVWTWTLEADGDFTAIKRADSTTTVDELNIVGTYETFATGFYRFTVASATGTDPDKPTAGDTALGFSVPGVVLVVKPTGDGSETLVMPLLASTCPAGDVQFNWVTASVSTDGLENQDLWGNATLPLTGLITGKKWRILTDSTIENLNADNVTGCTAGRYTIASGGFITMTAGGVGIVNTDSGGGDIIAFPRQTSVTEDDIRDREYAGFVFNEGSGGGETQPINISFPGSGDGTYTMLADVTTGAAESHSDATGPVTIKAVGTGEQAGFVKFIANASTPTPPTFWAAVATLGGRTVFFGSGANFDAGVTPVNDGFSVIAVEK